MGAGGHKQAGPGEAGEGPQPRDGAGPVVVDDGARRRDGPVAGGQRQHKLGVQPRAEDRDDRGAKHAGEGDERQGTVGRERGAEPPVETGAKHDRQDRAEGGDRVEGEHPPGLRLELGHDLLGRRQARVVDGADGAAGDDRADAGERGADAGDGPGAALPQAGRGRLGGDVRADGVGGGDGCHRGSFCRGCRCDDMTLSGRASRAAGTSGQELSRHPGNTRDELYPASVCARNCS
ncbi:hypothetical protein [Ornithinimicrobium kibberense]|uniref:hypothetical protein n=1 Tax=Ornithinimicrobium kibberense TaxID=282060 RepID=UPI00360E7219